MSIDLSTQQADKYLSSIRLYRFKDVKDVTPIEAYVDNIEVSQTIFSMISLFEIIMRNTIDRLMIEKYGGNYLQKKEVFNHIKHKADINKIKKSATNSSKNKPNIINSRMVKSASFGFWTILLTDHFLWCKTLNKLFSKEIRQKYKFSEIKKRINAIKRVRNMIAHHERIILKDDPHIINAPTWTIELIMWFINDQDSLFKNEIVSYLHLKMEKIEMYKEKYR